MPSMNAIIKFLAIILTSGHFLLQPISAQVDETIPVMLEGNAVLTCPNPTSSSSSPSSSSSSSPILTSVWVGPGGKTIATRGVLTRVVDQGKYTVIAGRAGAGPTLLINRVELEDDGVYSCLDGDTLARLHSVNVTVLVSVQSLTLTFPPGAVKEGSVVTVTCVTEGSKPAPDITWLKTDGDNKVARLSGANTDHVYSNGTMQRTNTLSLTVGRSDYLAAYLCTASVSIFTKQAAWTPDVLLSPMEPWLHPDRTKHGVGNIAHFQCVTSGSRPAAQITWLLDNQSASSSGSVKNQQKRDEDGTFSSSSLLTIKMQRDMNGAKLTCSVTNAVLSSQRQEPRTASVRLVVEYPPVVSISTSTPEVRESEDAKFSCKTDAEPPVGSEDVYLALNKQFLPQVRLQRNGEQFVLRNVSRVDRGQYQCVAKSSRGTAVSPPVHLTVHFSPVCVRTDVQRVYVPLRDTVTIPCHVESYPHDVTVTWVRRSTNETLHEDTAVTWSANDVAESKLRIKARRYEDIMCYARNSVGETSRPCFVRLSPPQPPSAPHNCLLLRLPDTSRQLRCAQGQDGGSPVTFTLQVQGQDVEERVLTGEEPVFGLDELDEGREYNLTVCAVSSALPLSPVCAPVVTLHPEAVHMPTSAASAGQEITVIIVVCTVLGCSIIAVVIVVVVCKRRKVKSKRQAQYDEEFRGDQSGDEGLCEDRTIMTTTRLQQQSSGTQPDRPDTPDVDSALLEGATTTVHHADRDDTHTGRDHGQTDCDDRYTNRGNRHSDRDDTHTELHHGQTDCDDRYTNRGNRHSHGNDTHTERDHGQTNRDDRYTNSGDRRSDRDNRHTDYDDIHTNRDDKHSGHDDSHTDRADKHTGHDDSRTDRADKHSGHDGSHTDRADKHTEESRTQSDRNFSKEGENPARAHRNNSIMSRLSGRSSRSVSKTENIRFQTNTKVYVKAKTTDNKNSTETEADRRESLLSKNSPERKANRNESVLSERETLCCSSNKDNTVSEGCKTDLSGQGTNKATSGQRIYGPKYRNRRNVETVTPSQQQTGNNGYWEDHQRLQERETDPSKPQLPDKRSLSPKLQEKGNVSPKDQQRDGSVKPDLHQESGSRLSDPTDQDSFTDLIRQTLHRHRSSLLPRQQASQRHPASANTTLVSLLGPAHHPVSVGSPSALSASQTSPASGTLQATSDKHLMASDQHLMASDKHLMASGKHLMASGKHLMASSQHLAASDKLGKTSDIYDVPRRSCDWQRAMSVLSLSAMGSGVLSPDRDRGNDYIDMSQGRRAGSVPDLDKIGADSHCQYGDGSESNYYCVPSNKHAYINLMYQPDRQDRYETDEAKVNETSKTGCVTQHPQHRGRQGQSKDGQSRRWSSSEQKTHEMSSFAPTALHPGSSRAVTSPKHQPLRSSMKLTPAPQLTLHPQRISASDKPQTRHNEFRDRAHNTPQVTKSTRSQEDSPTYVKMERNSDPCDTVFTFEAGLQEDIKRTTAGKGSPHTQDNHKSGEHPTQSEEAQRPRLPSIQRSPSYSKAVGTRETTDVSKTKGEHSSPELPYLRDYVIIPTPSPSRSSARSSAKESVC